MTQPERIQLGLAVSGPAGLGLLLHKSLQEERDDVIEIMNHLIFFNQDVSPESVHKQIDDIRETVAHIDWAARWIGLLGDREEDNNDE